MQNGAPANISENGIARVKNMIADALVSEAARWEHPVGLCRLQNAQNVSFNDMRNFDNLLKAVYQHSNSNGARFEDKRTYLFRLFVDRNTSLQSHQDGACRL
jgi:hypothetical protein